MDFPNIQQISDNIPLSQKLVNQLRMLITDGSLQPGSQLPNENDLAAHFNVSRSTIRSALQTLEKAGFVIRKRGIGTFVTDEPLMFNNLSINWGVTDVIRSTGMEPGTLEMQVSVTPLDEHAASRLRVQPKTEALFIERVRTADGQRVVFTQDYIPVHLIRSPHGDDLARETEQFLKENISLYSFVESYLADPVHHAIARISPLTADALVAQKLEIPENSGLLYLEQVDYNKEGDPLWLAKEFHVTNVFTFTVYRSL